MSTAVPPTGAAAATSAPATDSMSRLQKSTRDLEGVFVEQLFKAMRETVPRDGMVESGTGEEMFTALLDQKMASVVPARWESGLSEALLRQLSGRIDPSGSETSMAPSTSSSPAALSPILDLDAPPDASRPELP